MIEVIINYLLDLQMLRKFRYNIRIIKILNGFKIDFHSMGPFSQKDKKVFKTLKKLES